MYHIKLKLFVYQMSCLQHISRIDNYCIVLVITYNKYTIYNAGMHCGVARNFVWEGLCSYITLNDKTFTYYLLVL